MSAESPLRRKRCRDVEVDELELELQMLRRKNALILEDSQREKEKAARLLSFMEKENEDLRKVNTQFLDTFYEEKVSAQRRLRALELEKERAVEALAAVKKSANDVPLPPPSSMNDDLWMAQIADLQRQNESDRLSYKAQISSLLEEKKDLLKSLSDLRGQRTVGGVSSPLSEQQQHHPQTCVRCAGLERQLEEARREAVRVERRLRSQEVLETKLSSAEMRLRDLGETRREVAELQASLESAQRQADEWSRTLALVIDEGATASSSSSASSEVTPTRVLDFIVNLQRRCVLLKGGVGEAEAECSRLKEKLSQSDQSLAELRASLCQRERALLEAEQLAASAQRNLALYEREVLSLRGILKSYEAESRLGKTSTGSVDAHKDEMITSLRADLDVLRTKLKEREAPVEPTKGPNYEDALRRLETQVAHLKEATGLDFVPQETRVQYIC